MKTLDKQNLPSCAYFTFNHSCSALDINSSGTLIAAAQSGGSTTLFATDISTDLDDFPGFEKIDSSNLQLLVPRPIYVKDGGKDRHYYTRALLGPPVYCAHFSPESRFLLTGSLDIVRLWNCESYGAIAQFDTSRDGVTWCADWNPFGISFVTGHENNSVYLRAVNYDYPIRCFEGHMSPIRDVKYHPNAQLIASCSDDTTIRVWDIRDHDCMKVLSEGKTSNSKIQFTRNGKMLISGDEMGNISTWDIRESRKIGSVRAHKGAVLDITISMEGNMIATTGEDGDVLLWDTGTLCVSTASEVEPLKRFTPAKAITNRVVFSSRNLLHALGVQADVN